MKLGELIDDRYRLDRVLGRGSMGQVFAARHVGLDKTVALKALRPELLARRDLVGRFRLEARLLARLDHPGVVRLMDAGRHEGRLPYLVMELVECVSLKSKLSTLERLRPSDAIITMLAICEALEHAHSAGVVHRDLKPANILVDRSGRIKVADFGVGRLIAVEAAGSPSLTATGIVIGTPTYLSPEQILGKPVDPRTDLYALGVLGYQLLTGRTPFSGRPLELFRAHVKERPAPAKAVIELDAQGRALSDILDRLLEKSPDDRYFDAAALSQALNDALDAPNQAGADTVPWARSAEFTVFQDAPSDDTAPFGGAGSGGRSGSALVAALALSTGALAWIHALFQSGA